MSQAIQDILANPNKLKEVVQTAFNSIDIDGMKHIYLSKKVVD
jgi:hypothetical protein